MESIPKFLASVITIIIGVLVCVSLIIASVVVNSARVYHASVIDNIEASNFDEATILSCVEIAKDNGYSLVVEESSSANDPYKFYKVTLQYNLSAPIFGQVHTGNIVGFALSGAHMDVVVPGVEPGLYEANSDYSRLLVSWSDLLHDGVVSVSGGVLSGGSSSSSLLSGELLLPYDGSVTEIAASAFSGCTNLTGLKISEDVVTIGQNAFSGCSALENVELGNGILTVKSGAFSGCTNIANVNYVGNVEDWCNVIFEDWDSNPVYSAGTGSNLYFNGELVDTLIIPPHGTTVENKFVGCKSLKSLLIPDNSFLNQITDYAFYGCSNLQSVNIGNGIYFVGDYAFGKCSNLRTVTILDSVADISTTTFSECIGLQNIFVSDGNTNYRDENGKKLVNVFTNAVLVEISG